MASGCECPMSSPCATHLRAPRLMDSRRADPTHEARRGGVPPHRLLGGGALPRLCRWLRPSGEEESVAALARERDPSFSRKKRLQGENGPPAQRTRFPRILPAALFLPAVDARDTVQRNAPAARVVHRREQTKQFSVGRTSGVFAGCDRQTPRPGPGSGANRAPVHRASCVPVGTPGDKKRAR